MSALDILRVQVEIDLGSKCSLPVFRQNFLDQFKIQLWLRHHGLQVDSTLVLLLEDDVGWSLVHSDPEPFQLVLQDFLVAERLQHVQHNKDDVGGSCHCDNLSKERMWACKQISSHLSATAFAVLGSLYDSRQIEKLDLGSLFFYRLSEGRTLFWV